MIAANGLTVASGHFDYESLEERVDYAAELGLRHGVSRHSCLTATSVDGFHQAAKHLNKAAIKQDQPGLSWVSSAQLRYKPLGNETALTFLCANSTPL